VSDNSGIVGFHHPGLVVPDLGRASRFYQHALGFEVVKASNWDSSGSNLAEKVLGVQDTVANCVTLKGANCFLDLFQFLSPDPVGDPMARRPCDFGVAHLGFQVTDILAVFDRFVAAGGIVHGGPVAVGDGYSIYCRDPFGNVIELMQLGGDEPDFDLIVEELLPQSHLETFKREEP
jgi:catechol 2,3-dioxygenase-like lactoylglutathione lyase family enzyme